MKLIETLSAQPPAFWLSIVATIISICSFLFSLANTKRTRKLDTLQRRTQVLNKISEVESKLGIIEMNFRLLDRAMKELQSMPIANERHIANAIQSKEIEEGQKRLKGQLAELQEETECIRKSCRKITSKTDPALIEGILPEVERINKLADLQGSLSIEMTKLIEKTINQLKLYQGDSAA